MLHVRFRFVGKGDCIIIEGGEARIPLGIIDCDMAPSGSPNNAVTYLEAKSPPGLKFILLTHPHRDHYGGLPSILDYCERTDTHIELFGHSSAEVPGFLQAAARTPADERGLTALFKQVYRLEKIGLIGEVATINSRSMPIEIDETNRLAFLAPSDKELRSYRQKAYRDGLTAVRKVDANVLSLVTALQAQGDYVLLTADTERRVLLNIEHRVEASRLVGAQIPHHGSSNNHQQKFWIRRHRENDTQTLAISTGPNTDGHPDLKVIRDLNRIGFDITSTWLPEHHPRPSVSSALDVISTNVSASRNVGSDVVFQFSDGDLNVVASPHHFPARTL